ncbi:ATP-binding protein [Acidocella sp.]|uniref:ATP-binding protein n=1 Tax=Acidocella sp. TaxID=50710 RepID=UPI0017E1867E|nr:ATP-binding protein [Acidocella sp.]NNM58162.1 two-component sensor histidine kinase [Acidocella sp.]
MRQSLQFRLSASLSLLIAAMALISGAVSFVLAFQDAIELQDNQLREVAALIFRQNLPLALGVSNHGVADIDPEARVIVQLLRQHAAPEATGLPANLPDGMQTATEGGVTWRVYVRTLASGTRIAVAQQTAMRDEIAINSAIRGVIPVLLLIPLLVLTLAALVRKTLRPLKKLAAELDGRGEDDLQPLPDTPMPSEIRPFAVAINRLLARVAQSVAVQRRFVADAAHELRSPLTALSLQAEQLEATGLPPLARERLAALRGGIKRGRNLLEQLLALARAQEVPMAAAGPMALLPVLREILEELMPLAEAKALDLGVSGAPGSRVRAAPAELKTMFKNLVENAIQHSPVNGRIDILVRQDQAGTVVRVDDEGPGIAPEYHERVFDPFYRLPGNRAEGAGLGLSIVKTIAGRSGAQITLGYAGTRKPSGLRVEVFFPA